VLGIPTGSEKKKKAPDKNGGSRPKHLYSGQILNGDNEPANAWLKGKGRKQKTLLSKNRGVKRAQVSVGKKDQRGIAEKRGYQPKMTQNGKPSGGISRKGRP